MKSLLNKLVPFATAHYNWSLYFVGVLVVGLTVAVKSGSINALEFIGWMIVAAAVVSGIVSLFRESNGGY